MNVLSKLSWPAKEVIKSEMTLKEEIPALTFTIIVSNSQYFSVNCDLSARWLSRLHVTLILQNIRVTCCDANDTNDLNSASLGLGDAKFVSPSTSLCFDFVRNLITQKKIVRWLCVATSTLEERKVFFSSLGSFNISLDDFNTILAKFGQRSWHKAGLPCFHCHSLWKLSNPLLSSVWMKPVKARLTARRKIIL